MAGPLAIAGAYVGWQVVDNVFGTWFEFQKKLKTYQEAEKYTQPSDDPLLGRVPGKSLPLDPPALIAGVVTGYSDPQKTSDSLAWHGLKAKQYDDAFFQHTNFNPNNPNSMLGWIIDGVKEPGLNWTFAIDAAVWQAASMPSIDDTLLLLNRGNINEQVATYLLHRNGMRDTNLQRAIMSLRNDLPGIQDQIRFAVRDAFTPAIVDQYGYADDYPTQLDKYVNWLGLGWKPGVMAPNAIDLNQNIRPAHDATWGEVFWWAHWDLPSPTQAYEMMFRGYPNSRHGPSPYVLDANNRPDPKKTFTPENLQTLLKTADYPSYWRPRLEMISYHPLNITDTKRMYRVGVLDRAGVYHSMRSQGYADQQANELTDYIIITERPQVTQSVGRAFKTGIIDRQKAIDLLRQSGKSETESLRQLDVWTLDLNEIEIKRMINLIHRGMIDGVLDQAAARAALALVNITGVRIEDYLQEWSAEVMYSKRFPRLQQFMTWTVYGIMTEDELISRLQRLRYADEDINRIIKEVRRQRGLQETRLIATEEKDRARAIKQSEAERKRVSTAAKQLAKEQERQAKERIEAMEKESLRERSILEGAEKELAERLTQESKDAVELLKPIKIASTDKNLKAWHKAGLISVSDVRDRLIIRGFNKDDADKWIITNLGSKKNGKGT